MIIAMIAGILTNIFDKDTSSSSVNVNDHTSFSAVSPQTTSSFSMNFTSKEESCGTGTGSCCSTDTRSTTFSLAAAMKYAFVTLLGDIAKPLFWGLLLGALITVAIPENLSEILKEYTLLSYLIVIIIAVPMYVCATASLPIAAGLILSGVSAGAAFVFLSAGPATNTVTIGVVKKMLGTRSLVIYLGSIIVGSILFGLGLDYLFDSSNIDPESLIHLHEESGWISTVSAVLLWGFVVWFMIKPYLGKRVKG